MGWEVVKRDEVRAEGEQKAGRGVSLYALIRTKKQQNYMKPDRSLRTARKHFV